MKLVSWNVNSSAVRLPRVLELLGEHAPDVVLLQETKTEPDAFPDGELRRPGRRARRRQGALDRGHGGRAAGRVGLRSQRAHGRPSGVRQEARLPRRRAQAHRHARRAGRRLQRLPLGFGRLRPGRVRRLDARDARGARALRRAARRGHRRRVPPPAPGRGRLHLVGLPAGPLPRIDAFLVAERMAERIRACGIDRGYRKGPKPSDHAPLLLELA